MYKTPVWEAQVKVETKFEMKYIGGKYQQHNLIVIAKYKLPAYLCSKYVDESDLFR